MIRPIFATLFFLFTVSFLYAQESESKGFKVEIGDPSPDFKFKLTDGKKVSFKKLKGQVIMLQFTASYCKVCRSEMPIIEKLIWQEYKDKGLVLIGVDRDEPLETVLALAAKTEITYPLALDPGAEVFQLFAEKKSGITRNVVIDQQGNIAFLTRLFDWDEFYEMRDKIDELLKEGQSTGRSD